IHLRRLLNCLWPPMTIRPCRTAERCRTPSLSQPLHAQEGSNCNGELSEVVTGPSRRQKGHHQGLGAIILSVRMQVSRGLMTLRTEVRLRRRFHDQSNPIRFGTDTLQPQKLRSVCDCVYGKVARSPVRYSER